MILVKPGDSAWDAWGEEAEEDLNIGRKPGEVMPHLTVHAKKAFKEGKCLVAIGDGKGKLSKIELAMPAQCCDCGAFEHSQSRCTGIKVDGLVVLRAATAENQNSA